MNFSKYWKFNNVIFILKYCYSVIYNFAWFLAYPNQIYQSNEKNKVAIIGTVGLPAKYGGFETLAEHLVTHLSDKYDFTVYCSKKNIAKKNR